jgi:uroporphyrinogen-III synthase
MRVLVTRPLEDGTETARQLAVRGHEAILAPLLVTRFFDGPDIELGNAQAILATSANGVRALARRCPRRDLPVFAVGPQTAAEAKKLGFAMAKSADGDVRALAHATRGWAKPEGGALLHVVGEGNDGKLAASLAGFLVQREILYGVTPVETLPAEAETALRNGAVEAALFFSPRSAGVFRDLALKAGLALDNVLAATISQAAATALAPLVFGTVRIAVRPDQDHLLKLLD